MNPHTREIIARLLLSVDAVTLSPHKPFTWASGILSPIYCDNRRTLSYPAARSYVKMALAQTALELYPDAEVIAGVATGAISWGVLVADELGLPFVYVRPKPKDHGLENLIEGYLPKNSKVVVIEDLISTGGSSLKAVDALRDAGAKVEGLIAVYTHGFQEAVDRFADANCALDTLSDYDAVIEAASKDGLINPETKSILIDWRKDPHHWSAPK